MQPSVSKDVLFFGTYLSETAGSKASSETIAAALAGSGHRVRLVSRRTNAAWRIAESLLAAALVHPQVAVLDIYSSRVLWLSHKVACILAARGIPYIAVLRGGALLDHYSMIKNTLLPVLKRASRLISPSFFLRAGFQDRGFEVDRIPNALRLSDFPFKTRSIPVPPLKLLWVRAFTDIYRPAWAVEVVKHLAGRGITCTMTMVGPDKGLLAATRDKAIELGVGGLVHFTGPVPNAKLWEFYHSHDYLLNTTMFESFGVAISEAAATGLPVVSAAVGEVGMSWTNNENILLVPGTSSLEFANSIASMCQGDPQGEAYRSIGLKGRMKVEECALERVLPQWEAAIRGVCYGRPE